MMSSAQSLSHLGNRPDDKCLHCSSLDPGIYAAPKMFHRQNDTSVVAEPHGFLGNGDTRGQDVTAPMSQGSQDNTERPYLEWLHHAGCSEALQDQLQVEDQDACIPLKVSFASALDKEASPTSGAFYEMALASQQHAHM